jgi:hypothetical protein
MNSLIQKLDFEVIASGINKIDHLSQYSTPQSPYNLTLEFIMERLFYYFKGSQKSCAIVVESRGDKENDDLYKVFDRLMKGGNNYVTSSEFKQHIVDLKFLPKKFNENGNQISDLVVYPIARKIINKAKDYKPYHIIKSKFYSKSNGCFWGYGFKAFPQETYNRVRQEQD